MLGVGVWTHCKAYHTIPDAVLVKQPHGAYRRDVSDLRRRLPEVHHLPVRVGGRSPPGAEDIRQPSPVDHPRETAAAPRVEVVDYIPRRHVVVHQRHSAVFRGVDSTCFFFFFVDGCRGKGEGGETDDRMGVGVEGGVLFLERTTALTVEKTLLCAYRQASNATMIDSIVVVGFYLSILFAGVPTTFMGTNFEMRVHLAVGICWCISLTKLRASTVKIVKILEPGKSDTVAVIPTVFPFYNPHGLFWSHLPPDSVPLVCVVDPSTV